jgi:formate dehydrogenase major subunit
VPEGRRALQLAVSRRRVPSPMYREPGAPSGSASRGTSPWTAGPEHQGSRDRTFVTTDASGNTVNRCEGIAFAGGAAFSSEEGYLAAKLMRSLGVVHIEQQARV